MSNVQLISVLQDASSQDPGRMKPAEDQLKQWETTPGFYSALQDIFYDKSLPVNIRWLSIIYFKNGIDRYWRRTASNAIDEEEKNKIRGKAITAFDEENKQLAIQGAVVISKVARLDFPRQWPELLDVLLQHIQNAQPRREQSPEIQRQAKLIRHRSLWTLRLVIKALVSQKIGPSRKHVEMITPRLFEAIAGIFYEHSACFLQLFASNPNLFMASSIDENLNIEIELSLISLKCLRKLMVHGTREVEKAESFKTFVRLIIPFFLSEPMCILIPQLNIATALSSSSPYLNLTKSHMFQLGKLFIDLQTYDVRKAEGSRTEYKGLGFILMPGFKEIIEWYWNWIVRVEGSIWQADNDDPKEGMIQKVAVHGILIFKNLVRTLSSIENDSSYSWAQEAGTLLKTQIFTSQFVSSSIELLVRYLRLRKSDLENWENDPEGFVVEEEADAWEWNIRPCTEKLIITMMSQFREIVTPPLLQMLSAVSGPIGDLNDSQQILRKEAVYAAVSHCANDLYDAVDFDSWFNHSLVAEATIKDVRYNPVLSRIADLIASFIQVKISSSTRPLLYPVLLSLLDSPQNKVVRLHAVKALQHCIDDWNFEEASFTPFIKPTVEACVLLVKQCESVECRMKVLNAISVMIERLGSAMNQFSSEIVHLLPSLWDSSRDEHLFQSCIINLLTKLVQALRGSSTNLESFIIPLIQHGVDTTSPAHIYLLEDSLNLWLVAAQNMNTPSSLFLQIFQHLIMLLEFGSEHLKITLKIIESYVLLDPKGVTHQHQIFDALTRLLCGNTTIGLLSTRACSDIVKLLETILIVVPFPLIKETLIRNGLIERLIWSLVEGKEQTLIIVSYLTIISRIAFLDSQLFMQICGDKLSTVLDRWMDKWDNISHPRHRKLTILGLTCLLSYPNEVVVQKLQLLMSLWVDILYEVSENGAGDAMIYYQGEDEEHDDEESPEAKRKRELLSADPVHTLGLAIYINSQISVCQNHLGGEEEFQRLILQHLDPEIVSDLKKLLGL
ncbi:armadillo-type protein [Paraphysoderma sedebokerense]|nr:armadillo-type protein [Paraphysoderma sedebokerense]